MKSLQAHNFLPFFFIIGRPRSGTTLLRTIFDAHPNVSIPVEASVVFLLHRKYGHINHWNLKKKQGFFKDLLLVPKIKNWDIDFEKLKKTILTADENSSFQNIIQLIYASYQSAYEKGEIKILGDKNPPYSIVPEKIIKIFPDTKIIHLTRDLRDNAVSILNVDFEAPLVSLIAYRWKYSAKKMELLKKTFPKQFFTIKYEDFVSNPKDSYRALCDFLEIEADESVFDFYKQKDKVFEKHSQKVVEKYYKSLADPINTQKIGVWNKALTQLANR